MHARHVAKRTRRGVAISAKLTRKRITIIFVSRFVAHDREEKYIGQDDDTQDRREENRGEENRPQDNQEALDQDEVGAKGRRLRPALYASVSPSRPSCF